MSDLGPDWIKFLDVWIVRKEDGKVIGEALEAVLRIAFPSPPIGSAMWKDYAEGFTRYMREQ